MPAINVTHVLRRQRPRVGNLDSDTDAKHRRGQYGSRLTTESTRKSKDAKRPNERSEILQAHKKRVDRLLSFEVVSVITLEQRHGLDTTGYASRSGRYRDQVGCSS